MDFNSQELFWDAPVAYAVVDADGDHVAANRAFRALFGMGEDGDLPPSALALTVADDRKETARYHADLVAGRIAQAVIEKRYRRGDGTTFWARLHASALRDGDGPITHVLGVMENIDDEVEARAQLSRVRDEALAASDAKSSFVASVSHELRSPLHAILGLTELLTMSELDGDATELADGIQREAKALRLVIDDLLDFSKIEAGRLEVEIGSISPKTLIDEVVDAVRPAAHRKDLKLVVVIDPATPDEIAGDPFRVRQILTNLVSNALKYTDAGSITVVAFPVDEDRLRISVQDTGLGIPAAALDTLFEPFTQAHGAAKGTGLGLAISRRLAELLDGELGVESIEGAGSTFWVDLPASPVVAETRPIVEAAPLIPGASGKVLIVDDGEVNRLLATSQIDRLGYRHETAENGRIAIDMMRATDFDAVLMDWQMPVLDGVATTREWRAIERAADREPVPIIAMTANAMKDDREACRAAGMDDFLAKPVAMADLRAALERWIPAALPAADIAAAAAIDGTFDRTVFSRLRDDLGDIETLVGVASAFLGELADRMETFRVGPTGRREGDPGLEDIAAAAHAFTSTSALLGFTVLADRCAELQRVAADGDVDRAAVMCGEIVVFGEAAKATVEAELTDLRLELDGSG